MLHLMQRASKVVVYQNCDWFQHVMASSAAQQIDHIGTGIASLHLPIAFGI